MTDITVPKLNNNDDNYILVEWLYEDGQLVPTGEIIATVETSKAAEDLICENGGILHRLVTANSQCRHGDVIGRLFDTEQDRQDFLVTVSPKQPSAVPARDEPGLVITDSAGELVRRHGITDDQLSGLGKPVIRRADIEQLLAEVPGAAAARTDHLDRAQRAVAAVVSEAHRTIPAAFTVVKVDVTEAIELARQIAGRTGGLVGLTELVISAVAGLRDRHPRFFAAVGADNAIVLADGAHIGVTVDVGKGLFIPVIRYAVRLPVPEIAASMMDFRIKAMRGDFRVQDLAGASITVSLNNDPGVLLAVPIIVPGQTCMISVGATAEELRFNPGGTVVARKVAHIGLAYDHRAINGRDAVLFLQDMRSALQSADWLALLDRS